jgi:fructosamine-3-kinase
MRLGENALFHLPSAAVVVRIARTMSYWDDATKEVDVAGWLADIGFPAAETYAVPQPINADQHPVTFWKFIPGRSGNKGDIGTLGSVLRRLHSLEPPKNFSLPAEDILGRIQPRIERSPIPTDDKDFLLCQLENLRTEVGLLEFPLAQAPTHGDAHNENLMIQDGRVLLIDFERFAWGQPEWDLSMTATEYLTAKWWSPQEYQAFSEAYGFDVTTWRDGFETLKSVHELKMTTWLMQNVAESQNVADEYQVRMRTLRGEPSKGWRPF